MAMVGPEEVAKPRAGLRRGSVGPDGLTFRRPNRTQLQGRNPATGLCPQPAPSLALRGAP